MASLELVKLASLLPAITDEKVSWPSTDGHSATPVPLLFWSDGTPWREANLWIAQKAVGTKFATLNSLMSHLLAFAKWLERTGVTWCHFPALESERCLYRFRGALKTALDYGEISPHTASNRMRAIVQFYSWVSMVGLLSPDWPMWKERSLGIRLPDKFGFERTLMTRTTNLAISSKRAVGEKLEDGLYPVTKSTEREILRFVKKNGSIELFHILSIGFRTGMRLGTIADLKVASLQRATADPLMAGFFRVQVGPQAHPPVATKNGVNGAIRIHEEDRDALLSYAASSRRLKRQARTALKDRNLVFLTVAGRPYAGTDQNNYRAVEMELSRLRRLALQLGNGCLVDFRFHRSRASFGSNVARLLLSRLPTDSALQLLQELMLHSEIATTLMYVKFAERSIALEDASDAFTKEFLKLADRNEQHDP
ncbi:site-specific integrase [Xanthomonas citri pv. citri]|uniref:Integrase/recombinase n=1 Tax=Xanthomonas axonopodis pv. citri (strain 306) TaxID=190486 RepID=A0AAI7ZIJ0_XANAC|nr:site-specific integrase [Xanthomonas citri]AAM38769.1 integrase/recombinase [Xanthomonas citri pv. citri str. 306]AJD70510.1 hypothetical protein J151_04111 [Xanthomonas citri subsp. citri A306]CAE6832812.1 hypothetical protein XA1311A_36600 [Xanthomonas arboricola]AJY92890.1 Phage integrase family [Xanthomonas citri pv. citri]AJZ10630.1 Phage integrase family [Xanthomonas citri pv. citri]